MATLKQIHDAGLILATLYQAQSVCTDARNRNVGLFHGPSAAIDDAIESLRSTIVQMTCEWATNHPCPDELFRPYRLTGFAQDRKIDAIKAVRSYGRMTDPQYGSHSFGLKEAKDCVEQFGMLLLMEEHVKALTDAGIMLKKEF